MGLAAKSEGIVSSIFVYLNLKGKDLYIMLNSSFPVSRTLQGTVYILLFRAEYPQLVHIMCVVPSIGPLHLLYCLSPWLTGGAFVETGRGSPAYMGQLRGRLSENSA